MTALQKPTLLLKMDNGSVPSIAGPEEPTGRRLPQEMLHQQLAQSNSQCMIQWCVQVLLVAFHKDAWYQAPCPRPWFDLEMPATNNALVSFKKTFFSKSAQRDALFTAVTDRRALQTELESRGNRSNFTGSPNKTHPATGSLQFTAIQTHQSLWKYCTQCCSLQSNSSTSTSIRKVNNILQSLHPFTYIFSMRAVARCGFTICWLYSTMLAECHVENWGIPINYVWVGKTHPPGILGMAPPRRVRTFRSTETLKQT